MGGVIFIAIAVFFCILCCICCVAKSSSSTTRTVRVAQPSTTTNVVSYTTTQATTAYPIEQSYSTAPQQPPAAYPTPANPEFSSGAPPGYSNYSNYPAPANAPPTDTYSGYPPADFNAGYPPAGAGYPPDLGYPTIQH